MLMLKVSFPKIVHFAEQCFEAIFKESYLYQPNYLIEYNKKKENHPRYKNAIQLFKTELEEFVRETINDIDTYSMPVLKPKKFRRSKKTPKIKITIVEDDSIEPRQRKNNMHYELSKLHGKHPVFGVDYFLQRFKNPSEIRNEIINMKKNLNNDFEYYASYHYLEPMVESLDSELFYK